MKYSISNIGKLIACIAAPFLVAACSDDEIDNSSVVEFGITGNIFTVSANAGHVDLQLMSNQNCHLRFEEETPWAEISVQDVNGDSKFYIDYDDNPDFPRIAKVIVEARGKQLADTIVLRQRGLVTPSVSLASGSMILNGSAAGSNQGIMTTNLDFSSDVKPEVVYTGGEGTDWIESVTSDAAPRGDGESHLVIAYKPNTSANPRSATLNLTYDNGWGEMQSVSLFITQKNNRDELGRNVSFEEVRNLAKMSADVTIDDYLILTGYVVSDKASRNAGDNIQLTPTSIDYSICDRTVYFESLDGKYGFNILTATKEDNVFDRYDKVDLLLKGVVLHAENDPYRYNLSGITTSMIVGRSAGSASDIPVKEKYISELTDDDINTFVTLKDCEFGVRKGPLAPIHDGYTLADNAHRMTKYPRLMRDIQGSSIYLYTNTTCPYRRTGKKLPYGSGKISGVVVFEYFKAYVYGDGYDTDTHGRIGTYQLRHQSYDDIRFNESESFSTILTEYNYVKGKKTDADGRYYWYPTWGNNGRFTHSCLRYKNTCYATTTWNYLGWTGTAKGVAPFRGHVGNDGNGRGIILEDGTNWGATGTNPNSDGKGQNTSTNGDSWCTQYWWEEAKEEGQEDQPNYWLAEFSTAGISTDRLSMQISVQGGRALELVSPIYWACEWTTGAPFDENTRWERIGEYQVPDFPIWNNYHEWQLPAFKHIDFPLPLTMLGHEKVYVRFLPTSKRANTSYGFDAGEIGQEGSAQNPYSTSGSAMEYFAIRYNK
ncbi:DUF5689 domain-containing protein [uncultured Muribaculum sp.]|uniref:DUF5689 domain-containing protein n=1 Tax=uncultured Muribaculum sp. TaxID=1918613 RepID=UPI0025D669E5|nr:DUF5689 domain-containing protein [uncultured Muribaculum sp.]